MKKWEHRLPSRNLKLIKELMKSRSLEDIIMALKFRYRRCNDIKTIKELHYCLRKDIWWGSSSKEVIKYCNENIPF